MTCNELQKNDPSCDLWLLKNGETLRTTPTCATVFTKWAKNFEDNILTFIHELFTHLILMAKQKITSIPLIFWNASLAWNHLARQFSSSRIYSYFTRFKFAPFMLNLTAKCSENCHAWKYTTYIGTYKLNSKLKIKSATMSHQGMDF